MTNKLIECTKKVYRNVSHNAACGAFSSKSFDFKSYYHNNFVNTFKWENNFQNNACYRDFQKAAGIPTDRKLLVWVDMFLPESHKLRIQVIGNGVLQVCETYWENW